MPTIVVRRLEVFDRFVGIAQRRAKAGHRVWADPSSLSSLLELLQSPAPDRAQGVLGVLPFGWNEPTRLWKGRLRASSAMSTDPRSTWARSKHPWASSEEASIASVRSHARAASMGSRS
jgi:hypothetical protein